MAEEKKIDPLSAEAGAVMGVRNVQNLSYPEQMEYNKARRAANTGGGKKGVQPAAPVIMQQRQQSPQTIYMQSPTPQQSAPTVDYSGQLRQQQQALQARREADLKGQANEIVGSRLKDSQAAANLYGTRSAPVAPDEYTSLVNKEFSRLMTMDTGGKPEDLTASASMKKYQGFKRGRGWKPSEPLSEKGLLG